MHVSAHTVRVNSGTGESSTPADDADLSRQVDAVMSAARVLVGVVAQSITKVEDRVSLPQFRVLVMVATKGPSNLSAVAESLGVHPSNATRTVDRLVTAGLLDRRDAPIDRRQVSLTLTEQGKQLVDSVFSERRAAVQQVVAKMPRSKRQKLPAALECFAEAAGEIPEDDIGHLEWNN